MENLKISHLTLAFLGIICIGTAGYYYIENWSLIDSFFMTVITITTVGYREVGGDLSTAGKIFTTFLIFAGFGVAFIALSHYAAAIFRGQLNSVLGRIRMQNIIKNMSGHYIIAGYGRTGQVIASNLKAKKIPYLVIDNDEKSLFTLSEAQVPFVRGDAADEEVLKMAGVERAKGFIAVVSSDANNAFAIMTARGMNPKLHVIARALDSQNVRKLKIAGANKVVAPYVLGGMRIAQSVTHPHAADFVDLIEDVQSQHIEMADVKIIKDSPVAESTLANPLLKDLGVIVVGIRRGSGEFVFQPNANTQIHAGDHLVVMGPSINLEKMYQKMGEA